MTKIENYIWYPTNDYVTVLGEIYAKNKLEITKAIQKLNL